MHLCTAVCVAFALTDIGLLQIGCGGTTCPGPTSTPGFEDYSYGYVVVCQYYPPVSRPALLAC